MKEALHRLQETVRANIKGDPVIWLVVILLSCFSVLAVYSSTGTLAFKYRGGNVEYYLIKHLGLLVFGIGLMYFAHTLNYKYYSRISQLLLYASVPLLIFTLFFGSDINEAKRWITVPGINLSFQTSDLAKLALIMYTARNLAKLQAKPDYNINEFAKVIIPIFIICGLIAPADLSSASVLFFTCMLLLFIGRVKIKYLAGTIGGGVLAIVMLASVLSLVTGENRFQTAVTRIEKFWHGDDDAYSQVRQAKIAVATAGVLGKGPGNSTQRNFLSHPYSDFIFVVIFEEYGFPGAILIIFLYLVFLYRSIRIVIKSPGAFGALLAVGLSLTLVIQAFINMAVAVNLLPVTGLPLPLISMGGTSLWFTSIAIGIVLSVSRNIEESKERELSNTENLAA